MLFNFLFLFVNGSALIFPNTQIFNFEKKVHHLKPLLNSITHHINLKAIFESILTSSYLGSLNHHFYVHKINQLFCHDN